jgi:hypothetical protein
MFAVCGAALLNAVPAKDVRDRLVGDCMPEILHGARDASIAHVGFSRVMRRTISTTSSDNGGRPAFARRSL